MIAPIVEGHGDVPAIRVLLQKLAPALRIARPVRMPRSPRLIPEHLDRGAKIARSNIRGRGAVLPVLDADEDCAGRLGPSLEQQLRQSVQDCSGRVVLAVREFESWIVGGDIRYAVDNPDSTGGLEDRIRAAHGGLYSDTLDQPRLIATADVARLKQNSRSFRRLAKVLEEFVDEAKNLPSA